MTKTSNSDITHKILSSDILDFFASKNITLN